MEGRPVPALRDLSFPAVEQVLREAGVRPVHASLLWKVLYGDLRAADTPPPLRRWLEATYVPDHDPVVADHLRSVDGRTDKFLLALRDGQQVETVIMGYPGRFTACVSTQAGCAMGCVFCATGQMGFARQLTPGEIVSQVKHVCRVLDTRGERLRNVVLMGMGEPLANYEHVMTALSVITDARGIGLGPGHVTVNTVGVVPGIVRMADERTPYHLGVSLHGSTEEERGRLVPVSVRWPLAELIDACRHYCGATGRRIFFGWTLIAGVNDTVAHATRLVRLLEGIDGHVNLIRLNATAGFAGTDATDAAAAAFRAAVQAAGVPCTIRQLRGLDVAAGCGQLKAERLTRGRSGRVPESGPAPGQTMR